MGARGRRHENGFTLIELSIVLVIIGLIVGGILVGQNLIRAAGVRATISQIEKYTAAANTFRAKYNYLPGDIPDPSASSFGFAARGSLPGEGDGNGVIQGNIGGAGLYGGNQMISGEEGMFWVDLSVANLLDATFTTASPTAIMPNIAVGATPGVASYLPPAKLGGGNYIYVYSGGIYAANTTGDDNNYFGMSAVTSVISGTVGGPPGLTVQDAYQIDTKIDDGLPQSGHVTAMYYDRSNHDNVNPVWAGSGETSGPNLPYTTATQPTSTTCFDNGWSAGTQHYSVKQNNGTGVNCALSFQFE